MQNLLISGKPSLPVLAWRQCAKTFSKCYGFYRYINFSIKIKIYEHCLKAGVDLDFLPPGKLGGV